MSMWHLLSKILQGSTEMRQIISPDDIVSRIELHNMNDLRLVEQRLRFENKKYQMMILVFEGMTNNNYSTMNE
jgi:hypothetical protein